MLSATSTLSVTLGVLLQFLVGTLLPWRTVALVCLGPPILSFCLLSLMPESPHWFIMHNKLNHARKSLAWLRGWGKVEDVEEEFEAMCRGHKLIVYNNPLKNGVDNPAFDGSFSNVNDNQKPMSTETKSFIKEKIKHFKLFTRKSFLWPFAMVSFIYFLTNFTGAWTLQTYAINVFATLKAPMNKYYATILLGLLEFLGCTLSIFFVRYCGKRVMGFMSICAVALCDIVVGVYAHINAIHYIEFKPDNLPSIPTIDEHNWIPLVFLILIAFTGHCGLRVLPWILIGEIYSHETRATGCGAATFDGSFSNVNDNQKPMSTETKSFIKEKIEHFKLFTRKSFLWPFAMVSFIYFLTNFTGAWTLQTCAINVFATLKAPMNKYYATILLGLVEFLGCTLSIFFVRYCGKRVMGFMSICAVALCDMVVGVYAHINAIHYIEFKPDNLPSIPTIDEHNWILLVFLILIAFTGHCGLRVLPWILIGEIYSHETRATGCGAASAMSYVFGFSANKIFLTMINSLTIAWTYWCYGII
ncbi:hypothetical protein RN001_008698, partial [Aquatica leii]